MEQTIPIINKTLELADCRGQWFFDDAHDCWCLEDVLYTFKATTPKFQRLSIFVPKAYLNAGGTVASGGAMGRFTARTAPVVFENSSAGYMQMLHTQLGGPRDEAEKYLARGMVYVTCGCRGRDSRDQSGRLCAKSPWTLVDLKTAIRFLRHNAAVLPGDLDRIISVGCSAGGAMSSLVGLTGDDPRYLPFLEQNGAFLEESDAVYAAQVYCPIVDLDHADLAYEWQFQNDPENEPSHAGPAGTMTPFQAALSKKLAAAYVAYFNSLGLKNPETGAPLVLNEDGRSGSGYDYLLEKLEDSASDYLTRLAAGSLPEPYSPEDYLLGRYTHPAAPPAPGMKSGGDIPGKDKRGWLSWDGRRAHISGLDDYILNHRRRMKPCTSFDTLNCDSGENQEFGTPEQDYMAFSEYIAPAIAALKDPFPAEYARYYAAHAKPTGDEALAERRYLINPMNFANASRTRYFRIRVGSCDADTAFTISMALAVKLANAGKSVDYALVWDKPHCQADYPNEVCDWIEAICAG